MNEFKIWETRRASERRLSPTLARRALVVLVAIAFPAAAHAQVTLAWKLDAGERFALEETVQSRQTIQLGTMETRQDLDQTRQSRVSVLKKNPDGTLILEQKIDKVKVQHGSDGPDANTKVLKQLEGASFWYHVDGKHKIVRVEGYDALVKQLAKDNRADARLIRAVFTEESCKRSVDTWLGFLPAGPVDKGKTWKSKSSLPLGPLGVMAIDATYKLADFNMKTQIATISFSGVGEYKAPAEDADLPLKVTAGSLRLPKYEGTITFNADKGRLIGLETKMSLQGKLTAAIRETDMQLEITQEQILIVKCGPAAP
ncbi:MAG: hypothetical protein FJ271_07845 [Planctomycetes bacterium]|nr:hypothetical protein [Planctomycetota bacterium]